MIRESITGNVYNCLREAYEDIEILRSKKNRKQNEIHDMSIRHYLFDRAELRGERVVLSITSGKQFILKDEIKKVILGY